ncbi:MAG: hypothetical protein AAF938_28640 [Myxococcota bacterium]
MEAEFYAVGQALRKLDRPEVPAAFGHATFRAFVEAEVMGFHRAHRYMTVAEAYTKRSALSLGVEKAFHLVQYARVMNTRTSAQAMAERDARIGSNRERVSELTAVDVQNLVRAGRLRAAQEARPKVTHRERRVAAKLGRAFEERFGVDATVRVDKKRDVVRIEVRLADLLE